MSKLEPVVHNLQNPNESDRKEIEFITKDIDNKQDGLVKVKFKSFEKPFKLFEEDKISDLEAQVVYGIFNGWVVDDQGNTWYISNARGSVRYGTVIL